MIEEAAIVTRIQGENIFVKSLQTNACQQCVQRDNCGSHLYGKFLPKREMALSSELNLAPGDHVSIGIEEKHLLKASLFLYMIPLLVMLMTIGLIDIGDSHAALLAMFSLVSSLVLLHKLQKSIALSFMQAPVILGKTGDSASSEIITKGECFIIPPHKLDQS